MRLLFILAISLSALGVNAQSVSDQDKKIIESMINDWNTAWSTKDAALASKWYSGDAEFTNAFGFSRKGKEAIEEYLKEVFSYDFVMAGNSEQTSLKFFPASPGVIMVISTIERKGQKTAKGEDLGTRMTTHHRLFRKANQWEIITHLIRC